MDDYLGLPHNDEVQDFNIGSHKLSLVEVTDENVDYLIEVALSMYLGEKCKYCLREFTTLEELDDSVYAGYHEYGRVACKSCWNKNN